MINETWKQHPYKKHTEISDHGRVRLTEGNIQRPTGWMYKLRKDSKGRWQCQNYNIEPLVEKVFGKKFRIKDELAAAIIRENQIENEKLLITRHRARASVTVGNNNSTARFTEYNLPGCPWERGAIQDVLIGVEKQWGIAHNPEVGLGM